MTLKLCQHWEDDIKYIITLMKVTLKIYSGWEVVIKVRLKIAGSILFQIIAE